MDVFDTELETAMTNLESALYDARPDADRRLAPGEVNDRIRAAAYQIKRQDLPVDASLLDAMAARWERGYPDTERYQQDVRDAAEISRLVVDRIRQGR